MGKPFVFINAMMKALGSRKANKKWKKFFVAKMFAARSGKSKSKLKLKLKGKKSKKPKTKLKLKVKGKKAKKPKTKLKLKVKAKKGKKRQLQTVTPQTVGVNSKTGVDVAKAYPDTGLA